jgi:diaminopimelate decarboxylase
MGLSSVKRPKQQTKALLRRVVGAYAAREPRLGPERWGLEVRGNELLLDGNPLHRLKQEYGSPLQVVAAQKLRSNARAFLTPPEAGSSACEVYYSYKTNPVPGVLSLLHEMSVGAEVISHYEFWLARKLGVAPERIVYNGPAKSDESIREAVRLGIQTLNFNHQEEIARVARIAQEEQKKLRVGVRISVGQGWEAQFGSPTARGQALAAFREAVQAPWLDVVGLHAHRGGMILSEAELTAFVDAVLDFVATLRSELGLSPQVLNFGGSLGTPTVKPLSPLDQRLNRTLHRDLSAPDPDAALSIERYVALLSKLVRARYATFGAPVPRIFLEPGRSLTGNAQLLLTSVLSIKRSDGDAYAIMDAGINHAESVRSEYHQVLAANHWGEPADQTYTVVGPICSPGDTLYRAVRLPRLEPGDTLAIMDSGAYFVPFSTSFSFPRPAIVMTDGGAVSSLRRRETFDDIVCCDQLRTEGS